MGARNSGLRAFDIICNKKKVIGNSTSSPVLVTAELRERHAHATMSDKSS